MRLAPALFLCSSGALAAAVSGGTSATSTTSTGAPAPTYTGAPPPGPPGGPPSGNSQCLSASDASYLVNGYVDHVAQNFNATFANKLIAEGASVTSQSVLALMGKTGAALQGVTFDGKQAVLDGEKNKVGTLSIKVLGIDAVGCDTIGWRWQGIPNNGTAVRAISIFHAVKNQTEGWQIKTIYGEFNSLTWGEDVGANCTLPAPPS